MPAFDAALAGGIRRAVASAAGMEERADELARVRAGLAAQSAVARVLADAPTLAEATPRLLGAIGPSLGWELGALWVVDARDGLLRCQATWPAARPGDDDFERLSLEQTLAKGEGLPGRVWASGRPLWIADVLSEMNFVRWEGAAGEGFKTWFGFPIRDRDRILGVVEFFSRDARSPDEEILALTEMFGDQIGQYLRRRQAEDARRVSESRQAAILESALDAIITIDAQGRVLAFNPAAEQMFGRRHDEAVGREMAQLIIPPSLRERHREAVARVVTTGEAGLLGRRLELTGMRAGGEEFPVELTITRVDLEGPPVFTGYVRDITARKRAELRAEILAQTGEDLTASLDFEATLEAVARLCVPRIADWCVVDLVAHKRRIERVAVAHADPSKEALAWELERRYRTDLDAPEGVPKAVRTGRSELIDDIPDALLETVARDEDHLALIRSLGLRSAMVVPLRARGETLGAISFVSAESGRRFDQEDLAFAEELARRAALAIANARNYAERSRVAETLQASLLPPRLPAVPGLTVASRFRAAGDAYDVGGDFFDLFPIGPRDWLIVMGDVSGKGPEAAAVTALARYTVREAAAHEAMPSEVLARLNEAVLSRQAEGGDRFCTALVGRLRPGGSGAQLALASGGHPLPLRLDASGGVEPVGIPGLLLGFEHDLQSEDVEIELQAGDSLLLYTDGVTEAPTSTGLFGERGLTALLEGRRDLDAEALVDLVDRTVVDLQAGAPRDDIAMVALQVSGGPGDGDVSPGRADRLETVSLSS